MTASPFFDDEPDYATVSQADRFGQCRNMLLAYATGDTGSADEKLFAMVRKELLASAELKAKAPRFLSTCRGLSDFWSFIKAESPTYQGRREFLREQFEPLLDYVETREHHPAKETAEVAIKVFNEAEVNEAWRRMLERKNSDPEGAITAARSLVESVCKHILQKMQRSYPDDAELPKLYRLTAESLNLAPDQHTEDAFKRILGGCSSIIDGLANIRNRLSDAHGKGPKPVKPAPRHAELVVNVAGTVAAFLIGTWSARQS